MHDDAGPYAYAFVRRGLGYFRHSFSLSDEAALEPPAHNIMSFVNGMFTAIPIGDGTDSRLC